MADGRIYMLQPSFASGEISPDVASRVDLDKYHNALLQAENVFIRPYGSAYRRPGTEHVANLAGGAVRLHEFAVDADTSYLLVFREHYLYVYRDGVLKKTISSTPFLASELTKLRFAQSADVMFIASGTHPVQELKRLSDTNWTLTEYIPNPGYIDDTTNVEGQTITSNKRSGSGATLTYSGSNDLFTGQVGNWVRINQQVKVAVKELNITKATSAQGKETDIIHAEAVGWSVTSSGTWTGTLKLEYSSDQDNWYTLRTYTSKDDYNVSETGNFSKDTYVRLSATVSMGHLTASLAVQNATPITKSLDVNVSVTPTTSTSTGMVCGTPGWKVVSHGTWTGTFSVEQSIDDGDTWTTLRTYSSKDDFNVTESGTFDDLTYIRLTATIRKGNFNATLTRLAYDNKGLARITDVTDGQHCTARIYKALAYANEGADDWALGSWSAGFGYPSCVAFFQDRLCFAGNTKYPYMVWMSRTGDYWNFDVETASGEVLDDSAVSAAFISRKDYRILHMMADADLVIMTEGNEWVVRGNDTVTPKNLTPQVQTSRGTTDVIPEMIGGQMIYVQRHGKTVRDFQYNYTIDSYDGMDLNILAKHITQDTVIVDAAYRQEPDYMVFFVLNDGTAACLTYVNEQRVFAWCRMVTDGQIVAVEAIATPDYDDVYFVVRRGSTNMLEKLSEYPHTAAPDDYIMVDCARKGTNSTASKTVTASWLANKKVDVLADGRAFKGLTANSSGSVTLDVPCTKYVIGLQYDSVWELPNIEMQLPDGTLQGRKKKVAEVILRLENSLGGRVGMRTDKTDVIKYDELLNQEVSLYSGEKLVTVPNVTMGGFNDKGRVVVTTDDPYPLSISGIVRAVVPGG